MLERCGIISDEGQAEEVKEQTQDKKASLHTVRLPAVRSARVLRLFFPVAAAAKFIVGDGSPVPSGRNINRSGGRVPYSHPLRCR